MTVIVQQLILQLVLILLNSFFAATEIALISLNEKKVKAKADDGDKKAVKMLKIIEEPTKFLSTIQIGITLAGFLGSAFAADNFAERLSHFLVTTFSLPSSYEGAVNTAAVVVITLVLSYFTLVLGELVPKRIAMRHKEKLADFVCGIISALTFILKPIIWLLTASTNVVLRIFGINPNDKDEAVSEEDIVLMLDAGADEGTLNQDGIEYIKNVFKLDNLTAADVMTHRKSVVSIPSTASKEKILDIIETEGYSRIPVYSKTPDKITSVLYARDYLLRHDRPDFTLEQATFEPTYVPETIHLDALLKDMQLQHDHIVIVVDEYGIMSGIVTMEDIIEEIVGEIWDELDVEINNIVKTDENVYRVLCTSPIDEFREFFELDLSEDSESTTVNGWLIEQSGDIPAEGFSFVHENLEITVTKADSLMTHEILVKVSEHPADDDTPIQEEQ